jgi:VWFA-related protein
VCLGLIDCAWGQKADAAHEEPTIRIDINLVVLQALVLDRSGHPVSGLGREAFRLFVDGQLQRITSFQANDAPVTAGILVDNSASMIPKGPEVLAAAAAFARAGNPEDRLFVVHFSGQARFGLDVPFTASIPELENALGRFTPEGTTALYDAIELALDHFKLSQFERKVLLIVSDGGDNSSRASLPDIVKLAQISGVVIYCVGIYAHTDRYRNPGVLSQLAELTGGKAFFPVELSDVTKECVAIARDIRRQYTLGFDGDADGEYHRVMVDALDPKGGELMVHTRTGYFAPKR